MEENSLEEFSDEVREALFDIAEDLLKTDNYKIRVEPGSKKGDNFIGIVYRIICSTADEKRSKSIFIKTAPTDEMRRAVFLVRPCFMRETYTFEVILPYFREFQESRGSYRDGFHEYAKCYKSITTEPFECMFFQDMAQDDFVMIDRSKVTVEHILLVMKTLGKFHAVSFAMRDQEPEKYSEIVSQITEMFFIRGVETPFCTTVNSAAMNAINCITDDRDAHLVKTLLDIYEKNQYDLLADLLVGDEAEPYAVITHGDLWNNNTMFHYDDKNTLQKVCFIDWQLVRYGSPVLDLMYYIFFNTTREQRGRNYNIFLKTYYDSLASLLQRLGSDPERVFPFKAFQEQLLKFGRYGILNATFILPMQMGEISIDGNPNGIGELSDAFKKRFRDIAADSYRLGYI